MRNHRANSNRHISCYVAIAGELKITCPFINSWVGIGKVFSVIAILNWIDPAVDGSTAIAWLVLEGLLIYNHL